MLPTPAALVDILPAPLDGSDWTIIDGVWRKEQRAKEAQVLPSDFGGAETMQLMQPDASQSGYISAGHITGDILDLPSTNGVIWELPSTNGDILELPSINGEKLLQDDDELAGSLVVSRGTRIDKDCCKERGLDLWMVLVGRVATEIGLKKGTWTLTLLAIYCRAYTR